MVFSDPVPTSGTPKSYMRQIVDKGKVSKKVARDTPNRSSMNTHPNRFIEQ